MDSLLAVQSLRKIYRIDKETVTALDSIDLSVARGEICCILGTSGSGKSTLLNVIAGLEPATSGTVRIGHHEITRMNEQQLTDFRQRHVGFVFQSYDLMPSLDAVENVALPLMFRGVDSKKRTAAATEMLKAVGLGERLHHRPSQMSGGQQQRVGIARAFVSRPEIVFADEPTGNLDTKTTDEVMRLMLRLAHESAQTLVIVTHDRDIAEYADHIIQIRDGLVCSDTRKETTTERREGAAG